MRPKRKNAKVPFPTRKKEQDNSKPSEDYGKNDGIGYQAVCDRTNDEAGQLVTKAIFD